MENLTTNYRDEEGTEHVVEADSLPGLAQKLAECNYAGGHLRVYNGPGFTVGWVGADGYWRAG